MRRGPENLERRVAPQIVHVQRVVAQRLGDLRGLRDRGVAVRLRNDVLRAREHGYGASLVGHARPELLDRVHAVREDDDGEADGHAHQRRDELQKGMVPDVVARGERPCDWFMTAAQPREAVVAAGYEAEQPIYKSKVKSRKKTSSRWRGG